MGVPLFRAHCGLRCQPRCIAYRCQRVLQPHMPSWIYIPNWVRIRIQILMQSHRILTPSHPGIHLRKPPNTLVVVPSPQVVLTQPRVILLPSIPISIIRTPRTRQQLPKRLIRIGIRHGLSTIRQRPRRPQPVIQEEPLLPCPFGLAQQVITVRVLLGGCRSPGR